MQPTGIASKGDMVVKIPAFPKVVVFENFPRLDTKGGFQLQARLPPELPQRSQTLILVPDSHGPVPVHASVPYEIEFCVCLGKPRRSSIMALVKALRVSETVPEEPPALVSQPQPPKRRVNPPLRRPSRPPLPPMIPKDPARQSCPLVVLDRSGEPQRRHFKPSARPRMHA